MTSPFILSSSSPDSPPYSSTNSPANTMAVRPEEEGQKLLQFLRRRLFLPQSLLHRWIRTGQIRLNSGRCDPFARVQTGDTIRLPPFAATPHFASPGSAELPPLLNRVDGLAAFNKPSGLPVHGGTGHTDSLSARLAAHFPSAPFKPTPVHRLDRDTSGVLLVAFSYAALVRAQQALGEMGKEYVAWVRGCWPHTTPRLLRHFLRKQGGAGKERMHQVTADARGAKKAECLVYPLRPGPDESLVLVRLLTGRTHQIRVQLATLGHPVVGDTKYGPPPPPSEKGKKHSLFLHALRLTLPDGQTFACLPPWKGRHALRHLPAPIPPPDAKTVPPPFE